MKSSKKEKNLSDYCSILGISEQATSEEIRQAWYKKSRKLHPDKNLDIDTTEAMQEVNEAYEILSAIASRREKRTNFPFFQKAKPKKSRSCSAPDIFHFTEGWSVKIFNEMHMWIIHPNLDGCTAGITLSYCTSKLFSISLPLNFNETLKNRAWRQLISICRNYERWHLDDVELCFGLPKNRSLWPDIIDCIFRLYKTPLSLNQFMTDRLGLPVQGLKNFIPDFHSYPDMHKHDKWETHLTEKHLFLKHPTRTETADLTFFNLFESQFYITLPINNRQDTFVFFNEKLLPLVHEKPVTNDLYEIVIKLDKSEHPNDILECIFDFYEIPERIAKPIRQECLMPVCADNSNTRYWGI